MSRRESNGVNSQSTSHITSLQHIAQSNSASTLRFRPPDFTGHKSHEVHVREKPLFVRGDKADRPRSPPIASPVRPPYHGTNHHSDHDGRFTPRSCCAYYAEAQPRRAEKNSLCSTGVITPISRDISATFATGVAVGEKLPGVGNVATSSPPRVDSIYAHPAHTHTQWHDSSGQKATRRRITTSGHESSLLQNYFARASGKYRCKPLPLVRPCCLFPYYCCCPPRSAKPKRVIFTHPGTFFLFSPKCGFSKVTPLRIGSPGDTQRVCSQSFE